MFSMKMLYEFLKEEGWRGQLWMHIDSPQAGNWVVDMYKDHKKYEDVITNCMIDVSCDHFSTPDWLVHLIVYTERENQLWTLANPTAFTKNFSAASWPNPGKPNKIVYVPYPN